MSDDLLMQIPPVVQNDVTDWQERHQHPRRPFSLEPNNHHDTGNEAHTAHSDSQHAQFSAENKAKEQED